MKGPLKRKIIKYRTYPPIILAAIGVLLSFSGSETSKTPGIVCFAVGFLLLAINSIGAFSYAKANSIVKAGGKDYMKKAMPYLERACRFGITPQGEVAVGTIILQHGDKEKGKVILEDLATDKDIKISGAAKVSLSMYRWVQHDLDGAIALCREAKDAGYSDKNLYINLATYYYEKRMDRDFNETIKEARDKEKATMALVDLEAALAIRKKEWNRAERLVGEVFDRLNPAFIDPYLHKAMILLQKGQAEEAVETLETGKEKCLFSNTSIYTEEEVDKLITLFSDEETRWGLREAIEADPDAFSHNNIPEIKKGVPRPQEFVRSEVEEAKEEKTSKAERSDEDEMNTDLTDEDEAWLKAHSED